MNELVVWEELPSHHFAAVQKYAHHSLDNRRRFIFILSVVRYPFLDNNDVHVAEEGQQKDKLGNEFKYEIKPAFVVDRVDALLEDCDSHVANAEDHSNLHF